MIRVRNRSLPRSAQAGLQRYQAHVDSAADYTERVKRAKTHFKAKNRPEDPAFRAVRECLDSMCRGPRRCMYCEDAPADEIEHFHPKDLYPELVFAWSNYLYSCGLCNGPKNNRFAVVVRRAPVLHPVSRKRGDPVVPPRPGRHALIDPRRENPLELLQLDLIDTFEFVPLARPGTIDHLRAEYTLDVLRLNYRDYLIEARKNAYEGFVYALEAYLAARGTGRPASNLRTFVRCANHQTVWAEMKRQHQAIPRLRALFNAAPEALSW